MRRTTAIAWVGGTIAGIVINTVTVATLSEHMDRRILFLVALNVVPSSGCTLIGLGVFRRWLRSHALQARMEQTAATATRELFLAEIKNRQADIAAREAALAAATAASEERLSRQTAEFQDRLANYAMLQSDYHELVADYNRVVVNALQQSADTFRPRAAESEADHQAPLLPLPTRRTRGRGEVTHHHVPDLADPSIRN